MTIQDRPPLSPRPPPAAPQPETFHRGVPFICWGIIAVSGAVFALEYFVAGWGDGQITRTLFGPAVQAGEYYRLVTHVFEHGNALHVALNMSVVYTLGMDLERKLGHGIFAVVSLITAMGSATVSLLFSWEVHMLGASGMILGWAGAILPIATEHGRRVLWVWLAQVAIISLIPGISWQGHLGGFLFGLPCGLLLKLGRKPFWQLAPFLALASVGAALAATHPALHGG